MDNKELLKKLISFKTVYGNNINEFINCFDFIKEYLSFNKKLCFREFKYNNDISLLISNTKSSDFDLLFLGHIDVVPAEESLFKAKEQKGKLYGRGSFDMKGHDAVMINIMRELNTEKKIALILTSDEERGGFNGIPKIMKEFPFKSSLVIVPDGGNNFELIIEEKGVLQLEIISHGKSSHASKPFNGVNAIEKLINIYNKLIEIYLLPTSENDFKTSINLGVINGGSVINVVPDYASMQLDIRHTYSDTKDKIIDNIKKLDNDIEVNVLASGEPYKLNLNDENVKNYINCCEQVLNKKICQVKCESASDARFFASYGMNAIIMNACGNDMHGNNEYILISSLEKLEKIYKKIIKEI